MLGVGKLDTELLGSISEQLLALGQTIPGWSLATTTMPLQCV